MSLDGDGYLHIKNCINEGNVQIGLSCINNQSNQINYPQLKNFIDNIYFPSLQQHVPILWGPKYGKFRFSNKDNSRDASTFHADVYNHTDLPMMPIYSCLCYFDSACLEIIPGTHNKANLSSYTDNLDRRKKLYMSSGDAIIFHADMHHRGTKFDQPTDRRLLQIFEVFPNENIYYDHIPRLFIMQTASTNTSRVVSAISEQISKNDWMLERMFTLHYFLVYHDLQYKISLIDLPPHEKKHKYISYEPGVRKNMRDVNNDKWNINIICDPTVKTISPSNYYLIVVCCLLLFIIFLYYGYQRTKRRMS
jgi:hypothetical protein